VELVHIYCVLSLLINIIIITSASLNKTKEGDMADDYMKKYEEEYE